MRTEQKTKKEKSIKDWVEYVLKTYYQSRDNDIVLFGTVLNYIKPGWEQYTAGAFLGLMEDKKIPNMDDVIRFRRRLQQINIDLRGKSYTERHKLTSTAKKNLGYGSGTNK